MSDSLVLSLFYELNTSTSSFSQGLATTQQGGGSASAVSGKYKSSCCVHHTDIHLHPEKAPQSLKLSRSGPKKTEPAHKICITNWWTCVWLVDTASSQQGQPPVGPGPLLFSTPEPKLYPPVFPLSSPSLCPQARALPLLYSGEGLAYDAEGRAARNLS